MKISYKYFNANKNSLILETAVDILVQFYYILNYIAKINKMIITKKQRNLQHVNNENQTTLDDFKILLSSFKV